MNSNISVINYYLLFFITCNLYLLNTFQNQIFNVRSQIILNNSIIRLYKLTNLEDFLEQKG